MCVKLERMPLVVVIRGQTIQFPVVGAQMALATFITDDSTCSVRKGGEPTRSTPGGKQIQRYDAAAMHPFRFQIKGQEVEMLCKSFALAKTCNRVSSPSGDTVDIFAPGRDSLNSASSQQSMRLQRSLATSASKVCRRCVGASEGSQSSTTRRGDRSSACERRC